ncbi:DUF951 domain-containing protein [Candidatus Hakubella thermalkaliphila]|nr:DUF951 domain-containing protein [Candidatus Hakubella thermalkaliphila]
MAIFDEVSMIRIVPIKVGDQVKLKKPHPCGANDWRVIKLGMDIGLQCQKCGRQVRLLRRDFDRRFRGHLDGLDRNGDSLDGNLEGEV